MFSENLRYPDRPTTEGWRFWTSRCSVFNVGQEAIDVSVLGLFGPEGPYEVVVPRPMTLGPLESGQLLTSNDRDIVQFAVIRAPENAVVRAEVERRQLVSSGCGSGAGSGRSADLGEGRAPLPVFREPFPAGATTISKRPTKNVLDDRATGGVAGIREIWRGCAAFAGREGDQAAAGAKAAAQPVGVSSSIREAGCVATRSRTSLKYRKGSTPASLQPCARV